MAKRQPSETNQSVPESQSIPESHSYQEEYSPPSFNPDVPEGHSYSQYGDTVDPGPDVQQREDRQRSVKEEQPGESKPEESEKEDFSKEKSRLESESSAHDTEAISSASSVTTGAATASASATAVTAGSIAVTAAAVVIIAAAVIVPMIAETPSNIIFESIVASDSSVYYQIYFEDYDESMDLTVELHNGFTSRTYKVTSERIEVIERGLKPNMGYTISVMGPMSVTLSEYKVKTLKTPIEPTITMNSVWFDTSDGMIHFIPTVSDPSEVWTDYTASIYEITPNGWHLVSTAGISDINSENTLSFHFGDTEVHEVMFAINCTVGNANQEIYTHDLVVFDLPHYSMEDVNFDAANDRLTLSSAVYDPYNQYIGLTARITVTDASDPTQIKTVDQPVVSGRDNVFDGVSQGFEYYDLVLKVFHDNGNVILASESFSSYYGLNVSISDVWLDPATNVVTASFDMAGAAEGDTFTAVLNSTNGASVSSTFGSNDRTVKFDIPNDMRGTTATLTISHNGETMDSMGGISLDPLMTAEIGMVYTPSPLYRGLETNIAIYDSDGVWSDFVLRVTQGSIVLAEQPISSAGVINIPFQNAFVNGSADVTITCTRTDANGTSADTAYVGTVEVYYGPAATVTSSEYDATAGIATLGISITDDYNEWSGMYARVGYTPDSSPDSTYMDSREVGFANAQNTVTFEVGGTDFLNRDLQVTLWNGSANVANTMLFEIPGTVRFTEVAPTITVNNVSFSTADGLIHYTPSVSDPSSVWSGYRASVYEVIRNARGTSPLSTQDISDIGSENTIQFSFGDKLKHDAVLVIECVKYGDYIEIYESQTLEVFDLPYYETVSADLDVANDRLVLSSNVFDPNNQFSLTAKITVTNASVPQQQQEVTLAVVSGSDTVFENVSCGCTFYDVVLEVYDGSVTNEWDTRMFSSYEGTRVGNISTTFDVSSSYETLTATFDLAGASVGETFTATLSSTGGTLNETFDASARSVQFDITKTSMRGTVATLTFMKDNSVIGTLEGISLYGDDSRFVANRISMDYNPVSQYKGVTIDATINDPDGAWSGYRATVTQGNTVLGSGSIDFSSGLATLSFTDGVQYVNGDADIEITCTKTVPSGTSTVTLHTGTVTVYYGPTASVTSSSYLATTGIATLALSITDDYNEWDNLVMTLTYVSTDSAASSIVIESREKGFDNTLTSVNFPINDETVLGKELQAKLYPLEADGGYGNELFAFPDPVIIAAP